MPLFNIHEAHGAHIGTWQIAETCEELEKILPTEDVAALQASVPHIQKRRESAAARALVKALLENLGVPYTGVAKLPTKAPHLPDLAYSVSLSHTAEWATAILHPCLPVGIDIEQARPQLWRVAERMFSPDELAFIGKELACLTLAWSAKETLYKLYAQRQLHFTRDIQILPFDIQETAFRGVLFPNTPERRDFAIRWRAVGETHYCTWAIATA